MFSLFIDDNNPRSQSWLNMYWLMGGISLMAFFVLLMSPLNESAAKIEKRSFSEDFKEMLLIAFKPLILVFIASIFLYVLIEQSFQTWFPTFYEGILNAPASMAIQAGAVLAGAFMIGRFSAGIVLSRVKWIYVLSVCLIVVAIIVLIALPLANNVVLGDKISWLKAPLVVYIMPIMGLFLAPVYPTLNSTILSALPKHMHSSMSGLIVVFSALGGTTGSIITGHVFDAYSGTTAFYFSLIPITAIFMIIWVLHFMILKSKAKS